jgi:hypothetical protein
MSKILISPWQRKPNHPRYYVTDGREPLGTVFESRGIFTAIDRDGNLVAVSSTFQIATNALVPAPGTSS